jgi:hypothetical protein
MAVRDLDLTFLIGETAAQITLGEVSAGEVEFL